MDTIFPIIAVLGALVLALSGFRSHRLSVRKTLWMAAIWVAIIGGLTLLLGRIGM